jgi:hypothetical protein
MELAFREVAETAWVAALQSKELKCSHAAGGSSSGKPDSGTATVAAPTAPVPSCPPSAASTQPPLNVTVTPHEACNYPASECPWPTLKCGACEHWLDA